jgi:hypothetical protein
MTVIPTTSGGLWPTRAAYSAALLFTLASGGTNLVYGWNKGSDLGGSLIWSAVSLAVSVVFALSWPALIRSVDQRRWSQAGMVFAALLLTGAYSVSAALGSAFGGRENAATEQQSTTDARKRAQGAYDNAQQELAEIKPSRSVAEMEALVATARPVCRVVVQLGNRQTVCNPPPALVAELGRAKARAEWEGKASKASDELSRLQAPKVANSDAVALAAFLKAVGLDVSTDRLNRLLVLLAVLVIECGGGLSLSVGLSLSQSTPQSARRARTASTGKEITLPPSAVRPVLESSSVSKVSGIRLLSALQQNGGVLTGGQRELARMLGWSRSWMNTVLHDLHRSGLIKLATDKRSGTVVRLAN